MATIHAPMSQPVQALQHANASRLAAAAVKREVKAGTLTVAQALRDDRSGPLPVLDLLVSQCRWGRARALRLLASKAREDAANRISEVARVRDLTDRQRGLLASWCES